MSTMSTNGRAVKQQSTFRKECGVAINIQAPPDQIWAIFANVAAWPTWNSTITSAEGKVAVGEKIKLTVPYAPGRTFTLTIKELVPQQTMVWGDGMDPIFKGVRTYKLTPKADGSTDFSMVEVLSGVLLPLIGGSLPDFGPPFEQYAADLKSAAEAHNPQTA